MFILSADFHVNPFQSFSQCERCACFIWFYSFYLIFSVILLLHIFIPGFFSLLISIWVITVATSFSIYFYFNSFWIRMYPKRYTIHATTYSGFWLIGGGLNALHIFIGSVYTRIFLFISFGSGNGVSCNRNGQIDPKESRM